MINNNLNMRSLQGQFIDDRYLLKEYIAEGNFGAVFKGEQYFMNKPVRRVAIKISKKPGLDLNTIQDLFADVFMLAKVMDEIEDAQARSHLVHIYDMGQTNRWGKRVYVVMEYVQGTNLENKFRTAVPYNLLLKWACQICRAIKALHEMVPPVLHRDLKPNNILLGLDNAVRVVDFGLAANLLTRGYVPGTAGTTSYMAPETMKGESVPASDVYSIGVLLYEGLTGRHPFKDLVSPINLPEKLYSDWLYDQKQNYCPRPPSEVNSTIPSWLSDVIMRCLEFNRSRRFLNAGRLLDALELKTQNSISPGDKALQKAEHFMKSGDYKGARDILEKAITSASTGTETEFKLKHKLGMVLLKLKKYADAAMLLGEAWKYTEKRGFLKDTSEREELLNRIIEAFEKSGNVFQVKKYKGIKRTIIKKER